MRQERMAKLRSVQPQRIQNPGLAGTLKCPLVVSLFGQTDTQALSLSTVEAAHLGLTDRPYNPSTPDLGRPNHLEFPGAVSKAADQRERSRRSAVRKHGLHLRLKEAQPPSRGSPSSSHDRLASSPKERGLL